METKSTSLYAKDGKGQVRVWSIVADGNGLFVAHGLLGGVMQHKVERIYKGLAARTLEEQILSRYSSRIGKKIDSGYSLSLEDARMKERTNALGFAKPMLAAKFKVVKNIDYDDLCYQHKFDGNRVLVKNEGGTLIAYSRQGKVIDTIGHVLDGMVIPEGITLDGEIYCHGESLQTIVSWVKRLQDGTQRLRYHVYDTISDMPYEIRLCFIQSLELGENASVVETKKFDGSKSIQELLELSLDLGYEGLILRQGGFGYEQKRSKSLIKVKHFEDHEFLIVGMHLSKDGRPMLDCITDDGVAFKTVAPGSMVKKNEIYADKDNEGRYVHLEFANYTKDGVPFHPNALNILKTKDELK